MMHPYAPEYPHQMPSKKTHTRPFGICRLTGKTGPFVDSHIIPAALTRPSSRGNPLYQHGDGSRPTRRWTSWYDPELVTADGEKYLSDLDNWAIAVLRQHRLVWSGWGDEVGLGGHFPTSFEGVGARVVEGIDSKKLRLFFHSLLWRSAASTLKEFNDIHLIDKDLELLKSAILGVDEPPLSFYPVQLTQLSTRGAMHNQSPTPVMKFVPNPFVPGGTPIAIPTYRFYLDGLIAHVHRATPLGYSVEALGNLVLGAEDSIVLSTVTFETSIQALDLAEAMEQFGA